MSTPLTYPATSAGMPLFQIAALQTSPGVWFYDPLTPQPNGATLTPPALYGVSGGGLPFVAGYSELLWNYQLLSMDKWYKLFALWQAARLARGVVHIQWPDPQSGTLITASARMHAPRAEGRDVAVMRSINLKFAQLGIDDPNPSTGYWVPLR